MDEQRWLECTTPGPMLEYLHGQASQRKLRLFACACGYSVWDRLEDPRSREAVLTAERFADGLATPAELARAFNAAQQAWMEIPAVEGDRRMRGNKTLTAMHRTRRAAALARDAAEMGCSARRAAFAVSGRRASILFPLAQQLRCLFGNPFQPTAIHPAWLAWNNGVIPRLAQAAYDERGLCSGALDSARLSILADALEEADCQDPAILGHLRQPDTVHIRGCWCLDLLTGRE